jgi:hypothetical protein
LDPTCPRRTHGCNIVFRKIKTRGSEKERITYIGLLYTSLFLSQNVKADFQKTGSHYDSV